MSQDRAAIQVVLHQRGGGGRPCLPRPHLVYGARDVCGYETVNLEEGTGSRCVNDPDGCFCLPQSRTPGPPVGLDGMGARIAEPGSREPDAIEVGGNTVTNLAVPAFVMATMISWKMQSRLAGCTMCSACADPAGGSNVFTSMAAPPLAVGCHSRHVAERRTVSRSPIRPAGRKTRRSRAW